MNVKIFNRWGVASVGFTLLGVAHPVWDNISGAGQELGDDSHTGS